MHLPFSRKEFDSDHGVFCTLNLPFQWLLFYASNAWIALSPLSVTSKVSDGWGSAFSMMPMYKKRIDGHVVTKGLNMRWFSFSVLLMHVLSFQVALLLLLQAVASGCRSVGRGIHELCCLA